MGRNQCPISTNYSYKNHRYYRIKEKKRKLWKIACLNWGRYTKIEQSLYIRSMIHIQIIYQQSIFHFRLFYRLTLSKYLNYSVFPYLICNAITFNIEIIYGHIFMLFSLRTSEDCQRIWKMLILFQSFFYLVNIVFTILITLVFECRPRRYILERKITWFIEIMIEWTFLIFIYLSYLLP